MPLISTGVEEEKYDTFVETMVDETGMTEAEAVKFCIVYTMEQKYNTAV